MMESLMEALNSGEHFSTRVSTGASSCEFVQFYNCTLYIFEHVSTVVAWGRAVDYDVPPRLMAAVDLFSGLSSPPSRVIIIWYITSSLSSFTSTNISPEPMSVLQFSRPPLPNSPVSCPTRLIISASYQQRDGVQQCTTNSLEQCLF